MEATLNLNPSNLERVLVEIGNDEIEADITIEEPTEDNKISFWIQNLEPATEGIVSISPMLPPSGSQSISLASKMSTNFLTMDLVDLAVQNLGQFSFDIAPESAQENLVYFKTFINDTNGNMVAACQDLTTCSVADLMSNTAYNIISTGHLNETFFTDEAVTSVTTLDDFPKLTLSLESLTFNSAAIKGQFSFQTSMEKKTELFSFRQIETGNELEITCRYTTDGELICNADGLTPHTSYELQYTINYELGTTSDSISFLTLALPPTIQEITIFSTDFQVSWEPQNDATAYNAMVTIDGIEETMEAILGETKLKFSEQFEEASLNVQPERYVKSFQKISKIPVHTPV